MKTIQKDRLTVKVFDSRKDAGVEAAKDGANAIREMLSEKEFINIIFAAAPS